MIVGVCKLDLHLPAVHSLKEKRHILSKITSRTRSRFKIAISEVGAQELWQRTELGFCCVGEDAVILENVMKQVNLFIEEMHLGDLIAADQETFHFK